MAPPADFAAAGERHFHAFMRLSGENIAERSFSEIVLRLLSDAIGGRTLDQFWIQQNFLRRRLLRFFNHFNDQL